MTRGQIHTQRPPFSASLAIEAQGYALTNIKHDDALTDEQVGEMLAKSGDRAECYRKADAGMDMVTMLRGGLRWRARFLDPILATIGGRFCESDTPPTPDAHAPAIISAALLKLARAVQDGTPIDDTELTDAQAEIFEGGRLFDSLRDRLALLGIRGDEE